MKYLKHFEGKNDNTLFKSIDVDKDSFKLSKESEISFNRQDVSKVRNIINDLNLIKTVHVDIFFNVDSINCTVYRDYNTVREPVSLMDNSNLVILKFKLRSYKDEWFSYQSISRTGFVGRRCVIDTWEGVIDKIKLEFKKLNRIFRIVK